MSHVCAQDLKFHDKKLRRPEAQFFNDWATKVKLFTGRHKCRPVTMLKTHCTLGVFRWWPGGLYPVQQINIFSGGFCVSGGIRPPAINYYFDAAGRSDSGESSPGEQRHVCRSCPGGSCVHHLSTMVVDLHSGRKYLVVMNRFSDNERSI